MRREEPLKRAKPFSIPKELVEEAFRRVKASGGGPGADGRTIRRYEENLEENLYKLWNRMSSGSYFPKPVLRVEIPKGDGGTRPLGVPTVEDRVAQTVVMLTLQPEMERCFHEDSYAYRPGKSAVQAVGVARERCWRYDWVLDLDIKGFFDNIDHELTMRAVRKHTEEKWVLLYIERWLTAPVVHKDGAMEERDKGTPQGGVISPLLANLYLHYAFDEWMMSTCPGIPFERYADDIICHCKSKAQVDWLLTGIEKRLERCGLRLNREKTKIAYCKDDNRPGKYPNRSFDFLGFTYRPRRVKNRKGKYFVGFLPAVSDKAAKNIRQTMRRWRLHLRTGSTLDEVARDIYPVVAGWINYYGSYNRSALYAMFRSLNWSLVRWGMRKYKWLRGHPARAWSWLSRLRKRSPGLFAHWALLGAQAG